MDAKEFNRCLCLIAEKDQAAMAKLYKEYFKKFLFTIYYDMKNYRDAEDIASEIFAKILKNAANYKYVENPNAWIYQVAKFAIINFKKNNDQYVYTDEIDELYCSEDSNPEFKIDFKIAMDHLVGIQKEICQLHFLYDVPIYKTAQILNISRITVNRNLKVIRKVIGKYLKK